MRHLLAVHILFQNTEADVYGSLVNVLLIPDMYNHDPEPHNLQQRSVLLQSDTSWWDMAHCLEYSERVAQVQFLCPGSGQFCMSSWQRITNPFLEMLQDWDTSPRSWLQILDYWKKKERQFQWMQCILGQGTIVPQTELLWQLVVTKSIE